MLMLFLSAAQMLFDLQQLMDKASMCMHACLHRIAGIHAAALVCRYVQWCHGAPGFIPVLTKAYQLLEELALPNSDEAKSQILAAARKAADIIWERGLLTKVC